MKTEKDSLESRVAAAVLKIQLRTKGRYRFARKLGFSSREAMVLQNWSEDRIRRLLESKKKNT